MNHAGIALQTSHYDTVILGGGFLGLSLAFYLKTFLPELSLLLIEEEGIPSEQGMTHLSPGILDKSSLASKDTAKYDWGLNTLANLAQICGVQRADRVLFRTGIRHFVKDALGVPEVRALSEQEKQLFGHMLEPDVFPVSYLDETGAYASAEAASMVYGFAAVKLGLDLMLNTRVDALDGQRLKLKRLEFNRYMQRVVVREESLQASTLIVALGAKTTEFVEAAWAELLPYRQVYRQYPRIEADRRLPLKAGKVDLPIIAVKGFYFRPQGEGLLVIPPALPADPRGYKPLGATLMGVPVGVRRELLELFLQVMPELPLLTWESLKLGKTVAQVRGCWELLTPDAKAEWRQLSANGYSLVGGQASLPLALAQSYELAAHIAKRDERPWLS